MEKPSQSFTLIDDLIRLSRKHKTSEEFKNFIEFIGRFPDYAFYNRMLVYLQNPAVTLFGSHTFWDNCFKRKVKDNARPYIVLMPFGPVGLVFDIMDTEGDIDPKELLDQVTNGGPFSAEGDFTSEQLNTVIKEISKWGIETSFEEVNYFKAGMVTISENGKIIISLRKDLEPVKNFVTLLHELGHLFAGHLGGMRLINKEKQEKEQNEKKQNTNKKKKNREYVSIYSHDISHDAQEIEAETISWLICRRFRIVTKSAEYLAGYDLNDNILHEINHEGMIKAADLIYQLFCKDIAVSKQNKNLPMEKEHKNEVSLSLLWLP